jgi:hypothetical protein
MLRSSLVVSALLATVSASSLAADVPRHGPRPARLSRHGTWYTPGIRIWTNGSDLHHRGDRVRLYYRTERDAYVMIFRVDTDGRVQLLFPRNPDEENYGSAGATYSVASYDRSSAFQVDDDPGVGYIFAVASVDPFDYREIAGDGGWDLSSVSDGRIHGDPRSAMEELVHNLLPSDYGDFDTHLLPYYVDERYDYPRFVCYDCHTHTPYAYWNPYAGWCGSYTLTIFNDPYYYYPSYWYPTWYYGGQRVVYAQPNGSRYVFKNRDNSSAPGIDYRDRRYSPGTSAGQTVARTPEARGVRGADIGGVGSVPAPRSVRREAPPVTGGGGGGEQPQGRGDATANPQRPAGDDGGARRRPGGSAAQGSQPGAAAADVGGRRLVDGQPGIQIVPRTETPSSTPPSGERRQATGGYGSEPRPARPVPREGSAQPRPDATRAAPERRPESRPETRPESAPPRQPRPESKPEARQPESRQPQSRPQSQPQSQPQSRPQSAPSQGSDPGLVRRRP